MPPKFSNTPRSTRVIRSRALGEEPNQSNPTSSTIEIEEKSPPPNTFVDHQNPMDPRGPEIPLAPENVRVGGPFVPDIDPMILPRRLSIEVPQGLREVPIPHHLPKFSGSRDDDPAAHVERFEEILISSLVFDQGYYLIWFPNILVGPACTWYRSHEVEFFTTWAQLQATFLQYFRPKTGQQQVLTTLTNIWQRAIEDITTYVRQFQMVCTRFVGNLLNDGNI